MAFTFGKAGFRISFPDNWQDQTLYSFKGPEDSGIQHGLVLSVDKDPCTGDLVRYAKERIALIGNTLTGIEFLKEEPKSLVSGLPAYESVYKWAPCEGKVLWQKQVWIMAEGAIYNFAASFSKKTFKTIGQEVDEIINSFAVGDEPEQAPAKPVSRGVFSILKFKRGAKPPAKKPPVKKPPAKKPPVKKPVVKKPPAKKPSAKKPGVKKPKPRVH